MCFWSISILLYMHNLILMTVCLHVLYYVIILQVQNPEKYNFSPKQLLDLLTDVYLHLDSQVMIHAVATDGRSYSKELFDQCMRILYNRRIKSEVLL